MAFVDDPNKKQTQNTMNVLQPSADGTQPQQGGQQPSATPVSGGQGGAIQTAPSPRQQQKPASSGTFTNLQQYSQANKGGAQRIAQAATQNIAQQGKQVQQQVNQQAARTQSDIEANQAKIAQEQQFAQQQLQQAGQGQMADEDYNRFRNIVTGQTQFNDVRDLDLSQQRVQAQQLQQTAQQAGTDQGRLDLLRQTLGKGKEYTRGQSGLDAALVARDEQARQGLQQGVQQTAQQAQQALQTTQRDVGARRQALERLNREYGQNIMSEGEQATSGVMDAVNQGMMSAQEARAALAQQLGTTEADAEARMKAMAQQTQGLTNYMATDAGYRVSGLDRTAAQANEFYKQQQEALALAGLNPNATTQQELDSITRKLNIIGVGRNRGSSRTVDLSGNYVWDVGGASPVFNKTRAELQGTTSGLQKATGAEALARQLQMSGADVSGLEGGANELYSQLKAGQDINTQTAATQEQAQRYLALQDLLKGRNTGDRALSLEQAGKAQSQQQLLESARLEALRKLGIG